MSHKFWFLLISIGPGFGLNFGGSNLPDSLGHKEQYVPRDIPYNVSNISPYMNYVHVIFLSHSSRFDLHCTEPWTNYACCF